jgi:HSP20 family protein
MFRTINNDFNGILGGLFGDVEKTIRQQGELLLADIKETANSYVILADVPGVKKEDIKITFEDEVLKVETPERDLDKLEEGEKFLLTQRNNIKKVGHFKFRKAIDVNSVKAVYKEGVLMIEILKREKEASKTIIVE